MADGRDGRGWWRDALCPRCLRPSTDIAHDLLRIVRVRSSVGEGGGVAGVRVCGELGVLVRDLVAVAEHLGRKRWWNLGDQGS